MIRFREPLAIRAVALIRTRADEIDFGCERHGRSGRNARHPIAARQKMRAEFIEMRDHGVALLADDAVLVGE